VSVAPAKPAPGAAAPAAYDAFRKPVVRHAMHLLIPKKPSGFHRVEVRELRNAVRLSLDLDDDGIGVKAVDLSFTEANKLADMLNAIRRRVVDRKEWDT
jgi:hypothetical protein